MRVLRPCDRRPSHSLSGLGTGQVSEAVKNPINSSRKLASYLNCLIIKLKFHSCLGQGFSPLQLESFSDLLPRCTGLTLVVCDHFVQVAQILKAFYALA